MRVTAIQQDLNQTLRGEAVLGESLADFTTWRVGGPAARLYKPADLDDVRCFLRTLPVGEPLFWLGLGSNVLISDQGFTGTVILTQGRLTDLVLTKEASIRVEAGVSCAKMARFCARNQLSGGEFWAGIPGTMGGALRMNAGCFDGETWDRVVSVETITRSGEIRHRYPSEFQVSYRTVDGLGVDEWFVAAHCRLTPGSQAESMEKIKALLARRAATQPTGEYNCGSVFRNPPHGFAAQLIEACGLKGQRIGGAVVSPKHANFIVNEAGQASARDIQALIQYVADEVYRKHQVQLHREVHFFGDGYV